MAKAILSTIYFNEFSILLHKLLLLFDPLLQCECLRGRHATLSYLKLEGCLTWFSRL